MATLEKGYLCATSPQIKTGNNEQLRTDKAMRYKEEYRGKKYVQREEGEPERPVAASP